MGQWLIADLSVSDIHFQAWVFLVAGIVLLCSFTFWQRGSLRWDVIESLGNDETTRWAHPPPYWIGSQLFAKVAPHLSTEMG
jgi:hypothetical protein